MTKKLAPELHMTQFLLEQLDKFKKNRELIFGYTGFIGTLFTVFYAIFAIYKGDWAISFKATVLLLSFAIIFLSLAVHYIIKQYDALTRDYHQSGTIVDSLKGDIKKLEQNLQESHEEKANIALISHNIFHEFRKLISNIYSDLSSQKYANYETRVRSFEKFILFLVNNIKELFDVITKGKCSVCLKLITPDPHNEKSAFVKTFMRDSISYRERSIVDNKIPEFRYHENTAFRRILDDECPDSYYICNDLLAEKEKRAYINLNPDWQKYYNACLVVPIRIFREKINDTRTRYIVLGFLCVDNYHGGFDDRIGFNILAGFADTIFHLFIAFYDLSKLAPKPTA